MTILCDTLVNDVHDAGAELRDSFQLSPGCAMTGPHLALS
jgi:hypothetical protein